MTRKIMAGVGCIASALMGFAVYQLTGLADAFESDVVSYMLGFALTFLYLSAFRSGVLSGGKTITAGSPQPSHESEEERAVLCSECRRHLSPYEARALKA